MLVLSRHRREAIVISGEITVRVLEIEGDRVKLGIEAPSDISVLREELLEEATGENQRATGRGAEATRRIGSRQPQHTREAGASDDDPAPSL